MIAPLARGLALSALPSGRGALPGGARRERGGRRRAPRICAAGGCLAPSRSRPRLRLRRRRAARIERRAPRSRWTARAAFAAGRSGSSGGGVGRARGDRGRGARGARRGGARGRGGRRGALPQFFEEEHAGAAARLRPPGGGRRSRADVGGVAGPDRPGRGRLPARRSSWRSAFRYVRDPAAAVPPRAPRLAGTRVAGPAIRRRARCFCGVPVDPPPGRAAGRGRSRRRARRRELPGEDRRLARARPARAGSGRAARSASRGTAAAFVWHEWAEVRAGGGWMPVDPSFGELPARGPRFTLARFTTDDRRGAGGRAGAPDPRLLGDRPRRRVSQDSRRRLSRARPREEPQERLRLRARARRGPPPRAGVW